MKTMVSFLREESECRMLRSNNIFTQCTVLYCTVYSTQYYSNSTVQYCTVTSAFRHGLQYYQICIQYICNLSEYKFGTYLYGIYGIQKYCTVYSMNTVRLEMLLNLESVNSQKVRFFQLHPVSTIATILQHSNMQGLISRCLRVSFHYNLIADQESILRSFLMLCFIYCKLVHVHR